MQGGVLSLYPIHLQEVDTTCAKVERVKLLKGSRVQGQLRYRPWREEGRDYSLVWSRNLEREGDVELEHSAGVI